MQLESLLLSRDPEVIRVVQPALEKLSIDVEVCRGINSGQEILRIPNEETPHTVRHNIS